MKNKFLVKIRHNCRGCGGKNLFCFLDLGLQPLAGAFITKRQIQTEKKFPLKLYYCPKCKLVQVTYIVSSQILFEKYNYISSQIKALSHHFLVYTKYLKSNFLKKSGSTLIEFGCNDGVLLQHLKKYKSVNSYGVDPSKNVTRLARARGFKVWQNYFDVKTAKKMIKTTGLVDVVTGSNVFAHTDDISAIIEAAKILLKPDGVFIVEVHYLLDLIQDGQYDTFYHEHLSYYSVTSLSNIFKKSGLKIIHLRALPEVHGGSIRVIAASQLSKHKVDASVSQFIKKESNINLKLLKRFARHVKVHRIDLLKLLTKIKSQDKTIAAYGASGRATILLNYCQIDKRHIDYVIDMSPLRAGKLMPGVHVPIILPELARKNPPDYLLVTAWNYWDSILQKEQTMIKEGVKFIKPLPKIQII